MKFRFTVLAFVLAMMTVAAHAQVGLYFNPVVSRVSNSTPDYGPDLRRRGLWRELHLQPQPNFDFGVDVRDAIQHGDSALLNSFLVGAYIQAHPLAYGLKPYGQLSFGAGKTEAKLNPAHIEKFEFMVYGGVDKPLNKHVDFRVVEIGYGTVSTISSAVYHGSTPIPSANLLSFSTGFVFHIP
jgi:hypothetical protein